MRQLHEILENIFHLTEQHWVVLKIQGLMRLPLCKVDLPDTVFHYVVRMAIWTFTARALVMHELNVFESHGNYTFSEYLL
jgi:hypothetical protein